MNYQPRNAETWTQLVRSSCAGLSPETEAAVVKMCVETDAAGSPCGTWHAAASVTGTACYCAKCKPEIKRIV